MCCQSCCLVHTPQSVCHLSWWPYFQPLRRVGLRLPWPCGACPEKPTLPARVQPRRPQRRTSLSAQLGPQACKCLAIPFFDPRLGGASAAPRRRASIWASCKAGRLPEAQRKSGLGMLECHRPPAATPSQETEETARADGGVGRRISRPGKVAGAGRQGRGAAWDTNPAGAAAWSSQTPLGANSHLCCSAPNLLLSMTAPLLSQARGLEQTVVTHWPLTRRASTLPFAEASATAAGEFRWPAQTASRAPGAEP